MPHAEPCTEAHLCFSCKLNYWRSDFGMQVSPYATPTRSNGNPPKAFVPNNSWEKGIATDERGMPYLNKAGTPMGVKEAAEKRHAIEQGRRALKQSPAPPPSTN